MLVPANRRASPKNLRVNVVASTYSSSSSGKRLNSSRPPRQDHREGDSQNRYERMLAHPDDLPLMLTPRLCAWAGMATGMRSAPQVSAKGELHTSPATGGAMWAASPYCALCTEPTGCQDGSAQAEESVSRCGEGKALRSQLRGGAAMKWSAVTNVYEGSRRVDSWRWV